MQIETNLLLKKIKTLVKDKRVVSYSKHSKELTKLIYFNFVSNDQAINTILDTILNNFKTYKFIRLFKHFDSHYNNNITELYKTFKFRI